MKRQFVWAATIVVAALSAACDGAQSSAALSPTAPSATGDQTSANNSEVGLSAAQTAELTAACAFGSGTVTTPGGPPPSGPPPGPVTGGPGDVGPGGGASPGGPPPGPPAAGTNVALGGAVESLGGSCPVLDSGPRSAVS